MDLHDKPGNDRQMYEQLAVVSSSRTSSDEVDAILAGGVSEDVLRAGIARSDTQASRLTLVAGRSQDANTLGRVLGHPQCSIETIRSIRDMAQSLMTEGETWVFLAEFAERVIRRRETGKFSFQEEA